MAVSRTMVSMLVALFFAGCGPSASDDAPVTIDDLTASESAANVLAWRLTAATDVPVTVSATVSSEQDEWTVDGEPSATDHELLLTGLRANTRYDVALDATDADGQTVTETTSFTTSELPADLPPLTVDVSKPGEMADGFTLFNVFRWPAGENAPDDEIGWLIAVDSAGEIVWYATLDHRTDDLQLLDNGHLIYVGPDEQIVELDRAGDVVRRWVATGLRDDPPPQGAIEVPVDTFHHEVEVLPNGNLLTLSTELREITNEQCVAYESDSLNVVGDVVVEFDAETGEVVGRISTFDAFDPCRRTDHGFEAGFWNRVYGGITTQDWTHANAVFYDEGREEVVVSLRHQDWVVAYDFVPGGDDATGSVAWVLGAPDAEGGYGGHSGFDPVGDPFSWQYHQHAPMLTTTGTLLLYDNGNLRPGTNFDPDDASGDADLPHTRAVEYALDPEGGTVEQVWQWPSPAGYAPFVGDADELANGNVLVTDGGILEPPSDAVRSPEHRKLAHIWEVSREEGDEVVFGLTVADDAETSFTGYTIYRADRVTGFPR